MKTQPKGRRTAKPQQPANSATPAAWVETWRKDAKELQQELHLDDTLERQVKQFVEWWNSAVSSRPIIRISTKLRAALRAALDGGATMGDVKQAVLNVPKSDFLMGRTARRKLVASPDWVLEHIVDVLENRFTETNLQDEMRACEVRLADVSEGKKQLLRWLLPPVGSRESLRDQNPDNVFGDWVLDCVEVSPLFFAGWNYWLLDDVRRVIGFDGLKAWAARLTLAVLDRYRRGAALYEVALQLVDNLLTICTESKYQIHTWALIQFLQYLAAGRLAVLYKDDWTPWFSSSWKQYKELRAKAQATRDADVIECLRGLVADGYVDALDVVLHSDSEVDVCYAKWSKVADVEKQQWADRFNLWLAACKEFHAKHVETRYGCKVGSVAAEEVETAFATAEERKDFALWRDDWKRRNPIDGESKREGETLTLIT